MIDIGIGLIGSGFMGRSHAFALAAVDRVFGLPRRPRLEMLADMTGEQAEINAGLLGFARSTGDWRELIDDPLVDAVHVTAPNALHVPMVLAALSAGKAVHCEKPLAQSAADASRLAQAAAAGGAVTMVGFNYLKNPLQSLTKDLIDSGEIGEPIGFRGIHAEDFMRDPSAPATWRHDDVGGGATMDLGSHVVSLARFLLGRISRVTAQTRTVFATRPDAEGNPVAMNVDDHCDALLEFESGAVGSLQSNWMAAGRTMQLAYEITGTKGSIAFSQERMNELRLFTDSAAKGSTGFTTICAGPDHEPYGAFCPAPGHQLGFNDLKTIEMRDFLTAIASGGPAFPDFKEAAEIQKVIDAILLSGRERHWVDVE